MSIRGKLSGFFVRGIPGRRKNGYHPRHPGGDYLEDGLPVDGSVVNKPMVFSFSWDPKRIGQHGTPSIHGHENGLEMGVIRSLLTSTHSPSSKYHWEGGITQTIPIIRI